MAYADDILLTACTKQSLMDTFQQLKNNSLEVGLTINEKKTKYLKGAKKAIKTKNFNIKSSYIEHVKQYKYLGSIRNDTNSIEEEVKERIALGIKAYCANLKFFKSRLVTKSSKLKLYKTVIRPIVTCGSGTWVVKENIIQELLVFERKILRGIFGPTKENQTWRIKNNGELDKLIKYKNIVNHIKAQTLSWFGLVERMPETRAAKKMLKWNPLTTRPRGRPKYRWEDNLKQNLGQMKIKNWITCVQDRAKWKDVVENAKNLQLKEVQSLKKKKNSGRYTQEYIHNSNSVRSTLLFEIII
jgi:hypothetical protein